MMPSWRRALLVIVMLAAVGGALWALLSALRPLPERTLTMAAGPDGSAYRAYAERYRDLLAGQGVTVRLVPTAGTLEDLAKLRDAASGVSAAFVQAGATTLQQSPGLVSLGTMFYEPLWIFCRCDARGLALQDLAGRHVSIGPVGSATRELALRLMQLNGVDRSEVRFEEYPPEQAAAELESGTIDTAIIDTAWDSPAVRRLLADPTIGMQGIPRADAYIALLPYLDKVVLPMGVASLAENRPSHDVIMLAAKASLIVREDLHPALQYLLIDAAMKIHGGPGVFNRAGTFPAPEMMDFPLSDEANHNYRSGPSFLRRHLPFWLAELVQRLLLLAIPLVGLIYPVSRFAPVIWRWGIDRRLRRMYRELLRLERELRETPPGPAREEIHQRLDALESSALAIRLPESFSAEGYELKHNIRYVQQRYRTDASVVSESPAPGT
jgi:TRAP-type uncharacterized transport system substrate-binding protein